MRGKIPSTCASFEIEILSEEIRSDITLTAVYNLWDRDRPNHETFPGWPRSHAEVDGSYGEHGMWRVYYSRGKLIENFLE